MNTTTINLTPCALCGMHHLVHPNTPIHRCSFSKRMRINKRMRIKPRFYVIMLILFILIMQALGMSPLDLEQVGMVGMAMGTMRTRKPKKDDTFVPNAIRYQQMDMAMAIADKLIREIFADVCSDYRFNASFVLEVVAADTDKPTIHQGQLFVNPFRTQREEDYIALYNTFFAYLAKTGK